jgi:hypothetical protein
LIDYEFEENWSRYFDLAGRIIVIGAACGYNYTRQLYNALRGHRIFYTKEGYIGIGPPGVHEGDLVTVLHRINVPVLLREAESHFVLVGTCYVAGITDGEAVKNREGEVMKFEIH